MDLFSMDSESLKLAIQLQHEDLELWEEGRKGKQRAGEKTDADFSMETCRHELESVATLVSDHLLSRSIARAIDSDARIIIEARAAEEQATKDRDFAMRLSRDPHAKPTPSTTKGEKTEPVDSVDDAWIESFKSMNLLLPAVAEEVFDKKRPVHAESSTWASSRKQPEMGECIACSDRFPTSALALSPCSHQYCRECLISLVRSSLQDESLFPPRCCNQHIPIETGQWFSPVLVGEFKAKKLEFETPNRTYCSKPSCSTFVPPTFITGEIARCPKCRGKTCVHCKGLYHKGICQKDSASQQVLQLAAENGWKQCYACHRVVELDLGCNHITCLCKAQFCYVCGDRWKTCTCPQWQEERLVRRANAIVDRAGDVGRINARARQARLDRERRNLMENHECAHETWRTRDGPQECEECHQLLPLYIYECRQCRIMTCRRCRFNRL